MPISWEAFLFMLGTSYYELADRYLHILPSTGVITNQVDLDVAMLASLGGGHLHNLTWPAFEHHRAILT